MNIVKELRKKKGVQQKELAISVGVSQPTVSDWEANRKDPSGERLRKLAEYFGVDELVILGRGVGGVPLIKDEVPKTVEAKILAHGIDKLSKEQREQALNIMKAVFEQYADLFKKESYNHETQL